MSDLQCDGARYPVHIPPGAVIAARESIADAGRQVEPFAQVDDHVRFRLRDEELVAYANAGHDGRGNDERPRTVTAGERRQDPNVSIVEERDRFERRRTTAANEAFDAEADRSIGSRHQPDHE